LEESRNNKEVLWADNARKRKTGGDVLATNPISAAKKIMGGK
jgi:hypothetical protein